MKDSFSASFPICICFYLEVLKMKHMLFLSYLLLAGGVLYADSCCNASSAPTKIILENYNLHDPLTKAIILKKADQINDLLSSGVKPDDKAIVLAMNNGLSGKLLTQLAQKGGFSLYHIFSNGFSLVRYAIERADVDSLLLLIENGANFRDVQISPFFFETNTCNLGWSCVEDLRLIIQAFLKNHYSAKFIIETNPWNEFFGYRDDQCLSLLLEYGLNPNDTFKKIGPKVLKI
jgi:hypothetical protein